MTKQKLKEYIIATKANDRKTIERILNEEFGDWKLEFVEPPKEKLVAYIK